eukprot:TRINITY_DN449_c0_g1_i1.p1 TRINITY_DN449_c0_g1~~TRINITY_DN449_c0_g1_i1.p1  ORF type:complete len:224 (-),score=43.94 TRINITY_DN449_c0_g1_i1:79-750(-)
MCIRDSPNIVRLLDVSFNQDLIALKLEKVNGLSLVNYIFQKGRLTTSETLLIIEQVISALEYLHSKGWVHHDIKPDNIIFNPEDHSVKLIDFEFSCRWSKWRRIYSNLTTLEYSSPEIRSKKRYVGPDADMWSLGVTLFVMLNGSFPFSREELLLRKENLKNIEWSLFVSAKWQLVIERLMDVDQHKRLRLSELKSLLQNTGFLDRSLTGQTILLNLFRVQPK